MLHKKLLHLFFLLLVTSFGFFAQAQESTPEVTPEITPPVLLETTLENTGRLILPMLENGVVVEDSLSAAIQTRIYAFNANGGDSITLFMEQTNEVLDPFLLLLGPAGEIVASNDDISLDDVDFDYNARLEGVRLPRTGTYFVVASSYQVLTKDGVFDDAVDGPLTYNLSVEGISPVETSNDELLLHSAELVKGTTVVGQNSAEQPFWYFIFEGRAGEVVNLLANSAEFDTILHVYDANGVRLRVNDDINISGGNYNSGINLALPADGVYFVILSNPFAFLFGTEGDSTYGIFDVTLQSSQ